MKKHHRKWPSVPGDPAIPGYGSGRGNGGVEGANSLRVTGGCQLTKLTLATYNGRTIRLDNHLTELEVELSRINWHILGLSEVRREGEDTITLESGHLLYFREGDRASQGGVGFLVNKTLVNNVVEVNSVSNRVAYLVLKLTNRYSLKVVQVYAPTSAHSDEEVEAMYDDITKAIHGTTSAHYNVVMGDFNAKVGVQKRDEPIIGPYGLGRRNHRGQMLVNFLEMQGLFLMNSFYKKKPQRRWTWQSPDTVTRNEIDFIMADKKHIFRDVSVVNRFNTGSDHRLVRGTLNINFKAERLRLVKSTLRPTPPQMIHGSEQFQLELRNRFESLETTGDVDEITDNVVKTLQDLGRRHFPAALGQLKNGKAPGDDGITTELLKAGGMPILKALVELFNSVIHRGTVPKAWSRSVVVLFFKKGDNTLLKNYRPISLLSHVYKLFSRVVTNRLARRLDEFQPPEQAGFRKGYSTVDHIHTVRQIIQKTEEYNQPLCMAFVDYEKAFDSIETWAVLESLQRCRIDWRYIEVLRCLYDAATMTVQIQDRRAKPIPLHRGVRQGDVISPKLFTNAMEDVFKTLDWAGRGININGERISHLRFADDIVVFAETLEELAEMLGSLNESSRRQTIRKFGNVSCQLKSDVNTHSSAAREVGTVVARSRPRPVLVLGDFNAKSVAWGSPSTCARGESLEEWAIEQGLVVLNRGSEYTCVRQRGGSIVDITFASPELARRVRDWRVVTGVETLSDHRYIRFSVSARQPDSPSREPPVGDCPRWALQKLNREAFKEALIVATWASGREVDPPDLNLNVEQEAEILRSLITGVCDAAMPRRGRFRPSRKVYWWNPVLEGLRRACNSAHRQYTRHRRRPSLRRFCAVLATRPRLLYFHALSSIPNSRFHT
ncbi:hypothetical protein K1T71_002851 [Dendrolimus kikuchii]|uniref:Uncharacterized protein n=1 Tax=Dendrolimus kikuchii TaxID=765133 RepID=A0ACC1DDU8_9NEOP|nr:hypothetical protein K1T71_002851 [Dendrolimus kikuchii]